jgi:hypothetical protein
MAESTGVALAVGGITAANEALFAPLAGHGTPWEDFNWRIVPATAIFALALYGIEQISPVFAKGLGYIALITVLLARFGNAPSPVENLNKILGYGGSQK